MAFAPEFHVSTSSRAPPAGAIAAKRAFRMSLDRVPQIFRDAFKRELGDIALDDDLDLLAAGVIDSFALTQLALALEAGFPGLRIPDSDITPERLGSVAKTKAYLADRLKRG
jgi:acyl carrier protein